MHKVAQTIKHQIHLTATQKYPPRTYTDRSILSLINYHLKDQKLLEKEREEITKEILPFLRQIRDQYFPPQLPLF